ncbi:MAG: AraC family transcriptional regulator ligand-binding domain-containing protein, partial [Salinisphaeraceae bacterium]
MSTERQVPARYYARLMEVVRAMDIDTDALIADSGIAADALAEPEGTISLAQIENLLAATQAATGRSDLGLALAAALKLTSHSAVSYGILSSPTAGYALGLVARFFSLILPTFRVRYGCRDNTMRLTLTPAAGMSHACFAFHLELIVACVHRELHDLIAGDMPPYDVHFSIETPPHVARYDSLREMRTHFGAMGQPGAEMIWPRDLASRPLALTDPTALRKAESRCAELMERARVSAGVAA